MATCWNAPEGRCKSPVTHKIYAPDGKPTGYACTEHANAIVEEYGAKLGQHWIAVKVDEFGKPLAGQFVTLQGVDHLVMTRDEWQRMSPDFTGVVSEGMTSHKCWPHLVGTKTCLYLLNGSTTIVPCV